MAMQKSYKQYDEMSRYSGFPYYYNEKDNKYVYGTVENLDDTTSHFAHIVKRGDTFDSLALEYYNNPTYYWVIMDFNRYQDPFIELDEGTIVKIPSITSLKWEDS